VPPKAGIDWLGIALDPSQSPEESALPRPWV
jgi:hypothetical protein